MSWLGDALRDTGEEADRAGLGFFETETQAAAARLAVTTMDNIFKQAGSPAKYQAQVDAIDADWKRWDDSIVFYTFGAALAIGQRAAVVAQQIAAENGIAAPAIDPNLAPSTASQLTDTIKTVGTGLVIVSAIGLGLKVWETLKPSPTVRRGPPPMVSNPRPRRRRRRSITSLSDKRGG